MLACEAINQPSLTPSLIPRYRGQNKRYRVTQDMAKL